MADAPTDDNEFGKELAAAFEIDEDSNAPVAPLEEPKKSEEPTPPEPAKPTEEPKNDEPAKPEVSKEGEPVAPATDAPKTEEDPAKPKAPEAPAPAEEPKPLTEDSMRSIINEMRNEERTSGQALTNQVKDVMDAYYPDGLSNTLVDQATGKELKSPEDVMAIAPEMTVEEAAQWLTNEQFKLDQNIASIKKDAESIAENTLKFKQDSKDVLTRYEPLFKAYPQVQQKVWDQYNKLMKIDEAKGVVLSAPDMREFYDLVLDPYRMAFEHSQGQSATAPVASDAPAPAPAPATPSADDRLDEGGDAGQSPVDDPNDFAQQVTKELTKGF